MRNLVISATAAMLLGLSSPALAENPLAGSVVSVQQALFLARNIGVVGLNQVQFYDGRWEIEGRDPTGQNIEVDVDAMTGAILKVDRW